MSKKKERLGSNPLEKKSLKAVFFSSAPEKTSALSKPIETSKPIVKDWVKVGYIVRASMQERIRDYAYWERMEIREVVDQALEQFFKDKDVKSRPKR